ncbi:cytochrome c oxidase subunit 6C-1-like [Babylonia areolata]|uniref:cytochrome c oxidase subunit 6C-1-like n=1 Tax=Babylonia areolata TaxID=304850 RepID=UPI003FD3D4CD
MSAVARPQLRGFLKSNLKKNFIIATAVSFISTVAWRVIVCDSRKARYAEFYKTYDAQKDFERMKVGGVFHSVNPDGSVGEGW